MTPLSEKSGISLRFCVFPSNNAFIAMNDDMTINTAARSMASNEVYLSESESGKKKRLGKNWKKKQHKSIKCSLA